MRIHLSANAAKSTVLLYIVQYVADGESDVQQVHLVPRCKKPFHSIPDHSGMGIVYSLY